MKNQKKKKSTAAFLKGPPGHEKKDYGKDPPPFTLRLRYFIESILLILIADYLFYESVRAVLPMLPFSVIYMFLRNRQYKKNRLRRLADQFREALNSLNIAVSAGYSVENAVSVCRHDLELLYGREADIVKEFRFMEKQLRLSKTPEELFSDFAGRSHLEDAENFAAVFATAKRSGGDMGAILRKASLMIGDKADVRKEIETAIAARKTEQVVMSLMPAGIILYLKLSSPGFLNSLYGSTFGRIVMTICLSVYLFSFWLGRKITDIEV